MCVCVTFLSCTNDTSNSLTQQSFDNNISNINDKISQIEIGEISAERTLFNVEFFNELKNISSEEGLNNFMQKFQNKTTKIQNRNEELTFTDQEKVVFENYFELLNQNPEISPLIINETYVSEILSLNIENFSFDKFKNVMNFHHDLMVYLDYENDINSDEDAMSRSWNCGHRDCLDCCMYTQLKELHRSDNLIEKLEFFSSPATNTAWMAGRCAWDCW